MAKPFTLLIKPTSADCNLRCEYCFYLPKAALYPDTKRHRMPDEVLERMVASYMATDQPQYVFGWQGGEPTLMGVEFFRRATELQKRYGRPGAVVANGMQTNATLIDDQLAAHMAKYKFLVGVSIDGPAEVHDRYRRTADGRGTHAAVIEGIRTLERHGVEYNALVLVSQANVSRAAEIYQYLRRLGIRFHQYIPCVEFNERGNLAPYAITGEQWGEFLLGIFEQWYPRDVRRVSVRLFDSIVSVLVGQGPTVCYMGRDCRKYFVVEHNGDVYPCDFFVEPELLLGNVMTHSWDELQASDKYREFGRMKARWNQRCNRCEFLRLCHGDCLKMRLYDGRDPRTLSWLCDGWRVFYRHTLGAFQRLAAELASWA